MKSKLGRVVVQVGLDSTIGAATLNTGVFAINTVLVAAFTGRVSSLPDLWSAVRHRVRVPPPLLARQPRATCQQNTFFCLARLSAVD